MLPDDKKNKIKKEQPNLDDSSKMIGKAYNFLIEKLEAQCSKEGRGFL